MSHDEQRKRIFELECALGRAIKVSEQLYDQLQNAQKSNARLSNGFEAMILGIKKYLRTMNKQDLIDLADNTKNAFHDKPQN